MEDQAATPIREAGNNHHSVFNYSSVKTYMKLAAKFLSLFFMKGLQVTHVYVEKL
jgi:hypothetical protein